MIVPEGSTTFLAFNSRWHVSAYVVLQFCVSLHSQGLALGNISGQFVALSFEAKALGHPDPCFDFGLCNVLEGWMREQG